MIQTAPWIPIARPLMGRGEEAAVLAVMRSGKLAQGAGVKAFEEAFAGMVASAFAVATSSGSTALQLALLAHGVRPGDEVITTPLSFIASANAIVHAGARPVFADVDETLNLDPAAAAAAITPRTRAIMPVHLHGNLFDLPAFKALCAKRGLILIQDACQAVGATFQGLPLGAFGTAAYSFYASKSITTGGEGGMVVSNDPEAAWQVSRLRHHARSRETAYLHDAVGFNFRMTEIQAAIGLCQLKRLEEINERRRANAAFLDGAIDPERFLRPAILPGVKHVYQQYVLRVPLDSGLTRDRVHQHLESYGIGSAVHYPIPVHLQPPYRGQGDVHCPRADEAAADMLSIPVHPQLSQGDLDRIADAFATI
jgi:dTDP-4-amino-4,6-dideoxygalactose transaminase